jgi:predicted lipid-binding transport protein (Tim44 family)
MPFATTLPKPGWDASRTPHARPAPAPGPGAGIEEEIHRWVSQSFPAVQAAWSSGSPHGLQPYVSAALGSQLARELAALRRDGVVNRVEEPRLQEVTLLSTGSRDPVVEIVFTARDWVADQRSGRVVDGDPDTVAGFRQRWHLVRGGPQRWLLDRVEPS